MPAKTKLVKPADLEKVKALGKAAPLRNWKALLAYFKTATENDLWKLLEYEVRHARRVSFAMRIYGRACEVRTERERKAMFAALAK